MPKTFLSLFPSLALAIAVTTVGACKSEVDDKPKAKVEAAEKVDDKAGEAGEAGEAAEGKTLTLDGASSKVGFIGAKVTTDHKCSFEKIEGTATVEGDELKAMEITVDMSSLKTDADPDLGNHLKTEDFFDVEKHPEGKFTLLSVEAKPGEDGATHELAGNLDFHGRVNKVTFPATVKVSDSGVEGEAEFTIDRQKWGIAHPGMPDNAIKDEVALQLELNFK